jgi:hypothetical protein
MDILAGREYRLKIAQSWIFIFFASGNAFSNFDRLRSSISAAFETAIVIASSSVIIFFIFLHNSGIK